MKVKLNGIEITSLKRTKEKMTLNYASRFRNKVELQEMCAIFTSNTSRTDFWLFLLPCPPSQAPSRAGNQEPVFILRSSF